MYLPPYTYFTPEVARLRQVNEDIFKALKGLADAWQAKKQKGGLPDDLKLILQRALVDLQNHIQHLRERLVKARARAMVRVEGELLSI